MLSVKPNPQSLQQYWLCEIHWAVVLSCLDFTTYYDAPLVYYSVSTEISSIIISRLKSRKIKAKGENHADHANPKPASSPGKNLDRRYRRALKRATVEYRVFKGVIRAREGDLGIIPGSMGARSYIVRGKGSPESFTSCAHGAGRKMSRTAAEKQFTQEDLKRQTEGVICRKDNGVIDEIPGAYKNIDTVMANQSDLVEVMHTLKQVVCVK